jgi:hypothetical protein
MNASSSSKPSSCWLFALFLIGAIVVGKDVARGAITVQPGAQITVTGGAAIWVDGGTVELRDQSLLRIQPGAVLTAAQVQILPGGTLENCGEIYADIINQGLVVAPCGAGIVSTFTGGVTNSGVFRISHGSSLVATGMFANSGLLDLITAQQPGPPAGLVNTGTVLEVDDLRITSVYPKPAETEIRIPGIAPHTYRLQGKQSLAVASWADIGPIQIGNNAELIFIHPAGLNTFDRYFYRVLIGDQ